MANKIIRKIDNSLWFCCPRCGKKLFRLEEETELSNLPVYCRNCRRESIIIKLHKEIVEIK